MMQILDFLSVYKVSQLRQLSKKFNKMHIKRFIAWSSRKDIKDIDSYRGTYELEFESDRLRILDKKFKWRDGPYLRNA